MSTKKTRKAHSGGKSEWASCKITTKRRAMSEKNNKDLIFGGTKR